MDKPSVSKSKYLTHNQYELPHLRQAITPENCFLEGNIKINIIRRHQLKSKEDMNRHEKSPYENLIDINNNLSCMLKESFAEIDNICNKVRMCLLDVNPSTLRTRGQYDNHENNSVMEIAYVEEISQTIVDTLDNTDKHEEEIVEIEEEKESDININSEIQITNNKKSTPVIKPFFTIFNPTNTWESVESIALQNKLTTKCTTENFLKTMEKVDQLTNYEELLNNMVDDINKEIDFCYPDYTKNYVKKTQENNISKENKKISHKNEMCSSSVPNKFIQNGTKKAKNIYEFKKSQKQVTEDALSENELNHDCGLLDSRKCVVSLALEKDNQLNFTCPDVYRKRAITDLHQRLVAQVEANDSLIFFQRLMAKNRKYMSNNHPSSPISRPYTENTHINPRIEINVVKSSTANKKQLSLADLSKKYKDSLWFRQKKGDLRQHRKDKKKKHENSTSKEKCLPQMYSVPSALTVKYKKSSKNQSQNSLCKYKPTVINDQPLSEPEKCRMKWMRTKYFYMTNQKLEHLDILDDITTNDLLPIKSEYPRRDTIKKQQDQEYIKNSGDKEIIEKLSKYIYSGDSDHIKKANVFTVMPVHVYYDNMRKPPKVEEFAQKLPLLPMKECKDHIKKAEWKECGKKTKALKVVYDPILRRIDKEIRLATARQHHRLDCSNSTHNSSWSPKNFAKYCTQAATPKPIVKPIDKKYSSKGIVKQKDMDISSLKDHQKQQPKSYNTPSPDNWPHPLVPPLWNNASINRSERRDNNVEIIPKQKFSKIVTKEEKSKNKNDNTQRKIWENKYGKSSGQKLISFIEKQPEVYKATVPKYALPKIANETRQKLMLQKLHDLKQKNDNIQNNIQKAIEVIEKKMVDIISKPVTTGSMEAFEEMEKEITTVLSFMKSTESKKNAEKGFAKNLYKVEEYNEEIERISEELFKRLDNILESPGIGSGRSSKNSLRDKKLPTNFLKSNNVSTNNMNQVCFSSTSASGEEKFTVTGISPNRRSKNTLLFTTKSSLPNTPKGSQSENYEVITPEYIDAGCDNIQKEAIATFTERKKGTNVGSDKSVEDENDKTIKPIETIINLALVEHDMENPESGNNNSGSNIQKSSHSTDIFSHGDFDNQILVFQNDMEMIKQIDKDHAKLKNNISNSQEKEGNLCMAETITQSTSMPDIKERNEHISETSIDMVTNTDTQYFTPQTSPLENRRCKIMDDEEEKHKEEKVKEEKDTQYITPQTSPLENRRCKIMDDEEEKHEEEELEEKIKNEKDTQYFTPQASPQENRRCKIMDDEEEKLEENKNKNLIVSTTNYPSPNKSTNDIESGNSENKCETEEYNNNVLKNAKNTILNINKCLNDEIQDLNRKESDEINNKDDFYTNVTRIIRRVEDVYNQLDEFEDEIFTGELVLANPSISVFKDKRDPEVKRSDSFLTPFMHAVKDHRKTCSDKKESPKSLQLGKSPSYYNVLSFLDSLADFKEERPVEVYFYRICPTAFVVEDAVTFCFIILYNFAQIHIVNDVPKRISSCLKKSSTHSNIIPTTKSKQKVSFLLQKENKETQATACPFHSTNKVLSDTELTINERKKKVVKVDREINTSLDTEVETNIYNLSSDESYQSTFGISDQFSLEKTQMLIDSQIPLNVQENENEYKKNVVELFRNSQVSEGAITGNIKVFYDNYNAESKTSPLKEACGAYNEDTILQVEKSRSKDLLVSKRESLKKILKQNTSQNLKSIFSDLPPLKPLENLNYFVDSVLLKEVIEKRQNIRTMKRKSSTCFALSKAENTDGECNAYTTHEDKETILKGIYVLVYLLMFTALNLEFKCVQ
ncbi:uncharacterized protein LOC115885034 isoform X2 [Sitophilus oryzae]|uniref:Uncharacterized protein LOC115885034 isoform X2 n=1 Tax=Sitophilus oryzae TaxID=7048 RepID=A0A6J2Y724_SITOR|nr:uncharacterized protein LOC115885034 isoform X2 [Sitophilus oryzae]